MHEKNREGAGAASPADSILQVALYVPDLGGPIVRMGVTSLSVTRQSDLTASTDSYSLFLSAIVCLARGG